MRAAVEALVRGAHGELTLRQVTRIQTLCRIEMSARVLEQSIRQNPEMSATELRSSRESICRWSAQRDGILAELLGNDTVVAGSSADPFASIQQKAAE